jgi:CheB methylesterase
MYIGPPGRHLLVDDERLELGVDPRENNARPAIDPMLRSAAVCCGYRTIGVVLTGTLSDGASGLWALNLCGTMTVVQDPRDAAFPSYPARIAAASCGRSKARDWLDIVAKVGHAYTAELMRLAVDDSLPRAGHGLRALDQRVALVRKLHSTQAVQQGRRPSNALRRS